VEPRKEEEEEEEEEEDIKERGCEDVDWIGFVQNRD
jgi:hypothetical protein